MTEPTLSTRSFRKGLLAHLILVPAWTASPVLLIGGLVSAGAPHGFPGVALSLGLGAGLVVSSNFKQRLPMCIALCGLGAAAPSGYKAVASVAAGVVSLLAWLCKGGKSDFARRPALWEFLSRYSKDYYAQAELRGKLSDIQKEKSCFAFHPHGCLSAGFTINGCYNPEFGRAAGKVNWLCDYNLRYKNPGFRWKCDAVRRDDFAINAADKKTFQRLMASGENLSLIPGGFQDAVAFEFGKECTVLKRRKGFIKYCLQYGYRLHPVYTFGESETFHTFTGLRRLRMKISESNVPMVAFFGWPLLPFLPRPESRILTYVGAALALPHIKEPTNQEVDHWHGEYMKALTKLFNDSRAEAGWPSAELEIA
uniref:Acyltransferase n=1 Tax=Alexandrium monilatum TaxID=311494 RepID=A0A7S4Q342_9DINO|mmetsp:Transcript_94522/g.282230  ORF Transcript_94522/g.282230 Transcript_94522/m.282230 type:complete len:367 (+) Transcript_94522:66-1166(+)